MNKTRLPVALAGLLLAAGGAAHAQTVDPVINDLALFGINRDNGLLSRLDFADGQMTRVGTIRDHQGTALLGINGAAYIPGHLNILGFWTSPADDRTRLIFINSMTAQAVAMAPDLGYGAVTGAVAGPNSGNAVIEARINLNPSNSGNHEFTLVKPDGTRITRDDLHNQTAVEADGTFYRGQTSYVQVKPKANSSAVSADGQAVPLDNSSIYRMVGDLTVRLYNDHPNNGRAMGHWWIEITGSQASLMRDLAIIAGGTRADAPFVVYALQSVEAQEDEAVEFVIDDDTVTPTEDFALKVTVIGSAITAGGDYDVPVTTRLKVAGATHTPFGSYSSPTGGNVNDNNNPRTFVFPNVLPANTRVDVIARSWLKKRSNYNGRSDNHWEEYMAVDGSNSNSPYVKVLRNGDRVPAISGFQNQGSVKDFVEDYVDFESQRIVLDENQAIYLFELGTTQLNSSAADFQDLVVLVSLAKDPSDFDDGDDDDDQGGAAGRLLRVDHRTGAHTQLMTLNRVYDSLATRDGVTFYAANGQDLYRIDLASQTETRVGGSPADDMLGMEFAGSTLLGFEIDQDTLIPIDALTGQAIGSPADIGMENLGTIILMPVDKDPAAYPVAYD